jgi:hypothetical protein
MFCFTAAFGEGDMPTSEVDPWDYEAEFYIQKGGWDRELARNFVVARWMYWGDFRPLAAAIRRGPLDELVTGMLLHLIEVEDRLRVDHRRRSRPKNPTTDVKRLYAAIQYKNGKGKSDARFAELAAYLNMGKSAVRHAVTKSRKQQAKAGAN